MTATIKPEDESESIKPEDESEEVVATNNPTYFTQCKR